jgi:DNA-directed RNA polymerase specialized sigma24 family protein
VSSDALDSQMRSLLLQLSIKSHVAAGRAVEGARLHPSSSIPFGDRITTEEVLARHYARASSRKRKEQLIAEAQAELDSFTRAPGEVETASDDTILLEDGEGFTAEEVAQRFGVSLEVVYRLRKRHHRRADDGTPIAGNALGVKERRSAAKLLRAKGLSIRQIAAIHGVSTFTASTDLRTT